MCIICVEVPNTNIGETKMGPKDILSRQFLEEHYIIQLKSVKTIAEENGIKSSNSVSQALKRHGITRGYMYDSSKIFTKDFLEEYYIKQNMSLKEVAEIGGFKRKSIVVKALKSYGIPIRERTYSKKREDFHKRRRGHHTVPMRFFHSVKCGADRRNLVFRITVDDIWEKYQEQGGLCAMTKLPIFFKKIKQKQNGQTVSVDRIDNSKGYTKDNIWLVHKDVNIMKNSHSLEKLYELCELIIKNKPLEVI